VRRRLKTPGNRRKIISSYPLLKLATNCCQIRRSKMVRPRYDTISPNNIFYNIPSLQIFFRILTKTESGNSIISSIFGTYLSIPLGTPQENQGLTSKIASPFSFAQNFSNRISNLLTENQCKPMLLLTPPQA